MGIPVLGICYGCQLMAHTLGGVVTEAGENDAREYGRTVTHLDPNCILFEGFPEESITWMSHGDYISKVPEGFTVTGFTDACPTAAMAAPAKKLYGVQFHPEVSHTDGGIRMIDAFVKQICGGTGDWLMAPPPPRRSGKRSATRRSCWPSAAVWIPPWPLPC